MADIVSITSLNPVLRDTQLAAAGAVTDGVWIEVSGFAHISVHIEITALATAKIHVSNNAVQPLNSVHELEAFSTRLSKFVVIDTPVRWIKTRVSAWTSGTVSAWLEATT